MTEACAALAAQMVADAEGASKVVHVRVTGARSDGEAHRAARKVADSLLVKCSLNGEDPYWGRVASDLGSAGVAFDMDRLSIAYGGVAVCRDGRGRRPRRGGGGRPHGRAPRSTSTASSAWPTATGWSWASTWGTATSTRTGRRRDRRPTASGGPASTGRRRQGAVLVESLPYIRRFWGKVVVVKYGGNVLAASPGSAVDEADAWPPSPRTSC